MPNPVYRQVLKSQSSRRTYTVTEWDNGRFTCSCPNFEDVGNCTHVWDVRRERAEAARAAEMGVVRDGEAAPRPFGQPYPMPSKYQRRTAEPTAEIQQAYNILRDGIPIPYKLQNVTPPDTRFNPPGAECLRKAVKALDDSIQRGVSVEAAMAEMLDAARLLDDWMIRRIVGGNLAERVLSALKAANSVRDNPPEKPPKKKKGRFDILEI